jgi:hypothetical protein
MITNTRQTAPSTSNGRGATKSTQVATGIGPLLNPSKLQSAAPSPAAIAEKAYAIWLSQGQKPGCDQKNWFEAELQLQRA